MNPMNGNGAQQMQVNPIECARNALQFLSRVQFTRAERQAFDQVEGMLVAISNGQVTLSQAQVMPLIEAPQQTAEPLQ